LEESLKKEIEKPAIKIERTASAANSRPYSQRPNLNAYNSVNKQPMSSRQSIGDSLFHSNAGEDFGSMLSLKSLPSTTSVSRRLSNASIVSTGSTNSMKSKMVPAGSGSLFEMADEDGFLFGEKNLAEMQREEQQREERFEREELRGADWEDRVSEIQRRNTLLPLHLRDCHAAEYFGPGVTTDENQLRLIPTREEKRMTTVGVNLGGMHKSISGPSFGSTRAESMVNLSSLNCRQ